MGEKAEAEPEEDQGMIDKQKNWSAVNVAYKESKLNFRGVLTPMAFTNWLWYRCVRPKLEETKSKLPEVDVATFGIDDIEEIMGEFMPAVKVEKDKKDKKDDKDKKDKKDKKDDKDKKDKKDDKDDKKGKDKDKKK